MVWAGRRAFGLAVQNGDPVLLSVPVPTGIFWLFCPRRLGSWWHFPMRLGHVWRCSYNFMLSNSVEQIRASVLLSVLATVGMGRSSRFLRMESQWHTPLLLGHAWRCAYGACDFELHGSSMAQLGDRVARTVEWIGRCLLSCMGYSMAQWGGRSTWTAEWIGRRRQPTRRFWRRRIRRFGARCTARLLCQQGVARLLVLNEPRDSRPCFCPQERNHKGDGTQRPKNDKSRTGHQMGVLSYGLVCVKGRSRYQVVVT